MELTTLTRILDAADGLTGGSTTYEVAETHRVSFFIGQAGHAVEIADITGVSLGDGFVSIHRRDNKGTLYLDYTAVYGVSSKALKPGESRKTGFA